MSNEWGPVLTQNNAPASGGNMRVEKLNDWLNAKKEFQAAQAKERALRAEVESLFSNEDLSALLSGTESINTGLGTIKFKRTIEYKFSRDVNGKQVAYDNEVIHNMLDAIEKNTKGGNVIADRLVNWKPELSVREYKLLSPENKKRVDALLSSKQGSTAVEFEPYGV